MWKKWFITVYNLMILAEKIDNFVIKHTQYSFYNLR